MRWDEIEELAPLHVIGALDEKTSRNIESSLQNASVEEQSIMAGWRNVAGLLAEALPLQSPPDYVRARLLNRILQEPQQTPVEIAVEEATAGVGMIEHPERNVLPLVQPRRGESGAVRWMLMAATILLTFTSGYLFMQNADMARKQEALSRERDSLSAELDEWRGQVEGIASPQTKIISMVGDVTPQANAKVFWDMKTGQWTVYIFDLPAPPYDKDYQLWYVTKNAKISAAVFRTDSLGRTSLKLTLPQDAAAGLVATAVTLEPKGGSPQPTSKFYLKASV